MRQMVYLEPGRVEWREAPVPRLRAAGQAVVEPLAVATCDLDVVVLNGSFQLPPGPFPFGHEGIGRVIDIADDVVGVRPGDLVVVPFQISCGGCRSCRLGRTGSCTAVAQGSMYGMRPFGGDWGGFLADRVLVPYADAMLVPLPSGIDPVAVASASDNLPDALRTVGPPLAQDPGSEVLIVGGGAGSIPLYAVELALTLGSAAVHYVDTDPSRLELAETLGAHVVAGPPPTRLGPCPITVDASSTADGLRCALRSTAPDGTCTSIGIHRSDVALPLWEMYRNGIVFRTGRVHARVGIPPILELVAAGRLRPEMVTAAVVGWDEAAAALADPPRKLVMVNQDAV